MEYCRCVPKHSSMQKSVPGHPKQVTTVSGTGTDGANANQAACQHIHLRSQYCARRHTCTVVEIQSRLCIHVSWTQDIASSCSSEDFADFAFPRDRSVPMPPLLQLKQAVRLRQGWLQPVKYFISTASSLQMGESVQS